MKSRMKSSIRHPAAAFLMAALWLISSAGIAAAPGGPENLSYLTEDYPPSNYLENGVLKGVAVDVLRAVWKKMGVKEQPIEVINWARGYYRAERDPDVVLFAMTRNQEREDKFQWVGPIYRGRYIVYSRNDSTLQATGFAELKSARIAVLRKDSGDKLVTAAGIPEAQIERVGHVTQAVQMLQSGRVDLICIYADTLSEFARQQKLDLTRFKSVFVASENRLYFAFSKKTDPALTRRFQTTLESIDKERQTIVRSYGGTP